VDALVEDGHQVSVLDNLHRGRLAHLETHLSEKRIDFLEGDIRNAEIVMKACEKCQVVYHLAAQSNVIGSVTDINYSYETNVTGTFNLLKCAQESGVKSFVFTSSREVYGEAQYLPVDEKHPRQAKNAYGASKLAGEAYCEVFRNMNEMNMIVFRLANVYGSRDSDRVIPIFIERMKAGKPLILYGGSQVIDFISVDFIIGILKRVPTDGFVLPEPLNLGSGKGTTLYRLIERLEKLSGKKAGIQVEAARNVEVKSFIADVSRLKNQLAIEPPDDPLCLLQRML
jgi:UDP-glucose 4-epimerase